MDVGYVRVFKREENPDLQRREFEAAGCDRIFEEIILMRDLETSISEMREVAGISKAATYRYLEPDGRPRQRARHSPGCQGA